MFGNNHIYLSYFGVLTVWTVIAPAPWRFLYEGGINDDIIKVSHTEAMSGIRNDMCSLTNFEVCSVGSDEDAFLPNETLNANKESSSNDSEKNEVANSFGELLELSWEELSSTWSKMANARDIFEFVKLFSNYNGYFAIRCLPYALLLILWPLKWIYNKLRSRKGHREQHRSHPVETVDEESSDPHYPLETSPEPIEGSEDSCDEDFQEEDLNPNRSNQEMPSFKSPPVCPQEFHESENALDAVTELECLDFDEHTDQPPLYNLSVIGDMETSFKEIKDDGGNLALPDNRKLGDFAFPSTLGSSKNPFATLREGVPPDIGGISERDIKLKFPARIPTKVAFSKTSLTQRKEKVNMKARKMYCL